MLCDRDILGVPVNGRAFRYKSSLVLWSFPCNPLTCKCVCPVKVVEHLPFKFYLLTFFFIFINSRPPVSGIGLFQLPVHLQALRQAPCPKVYAKPEGTNGTHSPVLSPGASISSKLSVRHPVQISSLDVCPGSPLLSYPVSNHNSFFFGFAITERIILCLRNFPPVSATAIARPSAKAG